MNLSALHKAAARRKDLRAKLENEGTRCFRVVTEGEDGFDLDAYGLCDGRWAYFVQLKDPKQKAWDWNAIAIALEKELNGKTALIGGAIKTPRSSEPLPVLFDACGEAALLQTFEFGTRLNLEFAGVLNPGVFMDQRENRRELLRRALERKKTGSLLNLFSYTGAFSILAAAKGWSTTSVDLSKRYLSWERASHEANDTLERSRRIPEDARIFLERAVKRRSEGKIEAFDAVVLDPPTFSRTDKGAFRVQEELLKMTNHCIDLCAEDGVVLVSTNDRSWPESEFQESVKELAGNRKLSVEWGGIPEDFRTPGRADSVYGLKSAWIFRKR